MNRLVFALVVVLFPLSVHGAVTASSATITVDRTSGTAAVRAVDAPLRELIALASLRTGVFVTGPIPDSVVTLELRDVPLEGLLTRLVDATGLALVEREGDWRIIDPGEMVVTLDVVDGEIGAIIESVARQCGIRNVMIDQGMKQSATFRLSAVPCSAAIPIVFETLGIGGELHPNSVLVVRGSR